jgi:hypothetical protein
MNALLAPFAPGRLALGGSRHLPPAGYRLAGELACAAVGSGHALVCGCSVGADQAALVAVAGSPLLSVRAAFGPVSPPWSGSRVTAPGACALSAVAAVALALHAGSPVHWWCGGGPGVPLAARLAARTRSVAHAASAGALVVLSSPHSRGSLLLARGAAARGLPVVAVCCGFGVEHLAPLGAGHWSMLAPPAAQTCAAVWFAGPELAL